MMQFPPLTILEEFLLLALDDASGEFFPLSRSAFDCVSVGAVLMDLTLRRHVDYDLHNLFVIDPVPLDDAILDPALQILALAPVLTPLPIKHWLTRMMDEGLSLRERALRRLVARGVLKRQDKKIMWVFGARIYPARNPEAGQQMREVKLRVLDLILSNEIPDPRDIMLVALADACGLFRHLLNGQELNRASARVGQIIRMDLIGQAVAKAVTEVEASIAIGAGFS